VFGRRKRQEAATAEAAREAERRALFARLAERPEHVCPFLGLEGDRTGYVEGISDEHRCFAFGDPAAISAEQQTRVCQERGYGNCPRYLRGVLVIPTEELEALRRPRAAIAPPLPAAAEPAQRRRVPALLVVLALLLLLGGAAAGYLLFVGGRSTAVVDPSPSVMPSAAIGASVAPTPSVTRSVLPSPSPEPTPDAGDSFAFYEVSVGPEEFSLFDLDAGGERVERRVIAFSAYSFARVEAEVAADGEVYWITRNGDLTGYGYVYPESGNFSIRAVFLSDEDGSRRSVYLDGGELTELPGPTPSPIP